MTNWRQHRQMLLALTFAGVFFTLGRFSLDPSAGNRSPAAFAFPEVVPLSGWQLLESRAVAEPIARRPDAYEAVLASRKYRYRKNNQQLEISMRYELGSLGKLDSYLKDYTSIQLEDTQLLHNLRQQEEVGFYSLFFTKGASHLVAINLRGGSTVTSDQFLANRQTYDLQMRRMVPWLLGKESLLDKRCLWAHLSTPLNQVSAETTYPVLKQAWLSWYKWWNPRFPHL